MKSRIKIVFIITDLDIGGAEEMLYQLISRLEKESYAVELISLSKYGVMAQKFMRLGVPIRSLEMNSKAFNPFKFLKLVTWLKEINPDIIQTWMYHANLLGGIAGRLSSKVPIIWGIHHANLDIKYTKLATLIIVKICAMLSFFLPKRIVYCSQKAIETHIKFGYDCTKSIYIPNGFSTDRFFPSIQKRTDFRDSLGLKFDTPLIGMAARFHPIKDHENFISAAAKLHKEMPEVKFVLCGTGIETSNTTLMNKIIENNLESSVLLLGYRSDMANFYNGIDVGTLTSISEAFPNVVGEMMACGLPVVI
ncbi:MAG: glycosyltransferase, partial [Anaerolineaceae bacterium]|nr:glycosyltransferase [Anaerolineaceae bacterium]